MRTSASQIGLLISLSKYLNPSGRIIRTGMMKNDGRWWHWDTGEHMTLTREGSKFTICIESPNNGTGQATMSEDLAIFYTDIITTNQD